MKCIECNNYVDKICLLARENVRCINFSQFKERPIVYCQDCKNSDDIKKVCKLGLGVFCKFEAKENINFTEKLKDVKEKLVQAKKNQEAEEEVLRRLQMLKFVPIEASEIQSPQIVRMSLQGYENLTNRVCNQELEIKNLKYAIEDMNSKLLKKNKEINELQAVIKTLGGLL